MLSSDFATFSRFVSENSMGSDRKKDDLLFGRAKHIGRGKIPLGEVGHDHPESLARKQVCACRGSQREWTGHTLERLGSEAKDIVDGEDGGLCVLRPYDVGFEPGYVAVGALGGVVGFDRG